MATVGFTHILKHIFSSFSILGSFEYRVFVFSFWDRLFGGLFQTTSTKLCVLTIIGLFCLCRYLKGLANNLEKFIQDNITREAFVEAYGARHVIHFKCLPADPRVKPFDGNSDYVFITNENGALTINIYKDRVTMCADTTGTIGLAASISEGPLSVLQRKNIAVNETSSRPKHLKTILDATGIDFDTEVQWAEFAVATEDKGYKERVGDIVYDWYLKALAANVVTFSKDNIQREAFVETFGTRKLISFRLIEETAPKSKSQYYSVTNEGGVLSANIVKSRITTNASNFGEDLALACSGDGPLTVLMRKNIADATKQMNEHLATINKASGIEFDVEVDWAQFAVATVDKGYQDRVGDIIYNWYLKGFAKHVETFCKDPIQREAFTESFGSRKQIAFILAADKHADRRSTYHFTLNHDGVCEIHIVKDRFTTSADSTGEDLAQACSGDGPLSVTTRKNISDSAETRAGFIGRINKASGLQFEYEIDWESVAPACKERGYDNRAGEVVGWYLKGLAENVEKICADDMGKEAFAEACEKQNILVKAVPQDEVGSNGYVTCVLKEGVLIVSIGKDRITTNAGNTGSDIMSQL